MKLRGAEQTDLAFVMETERLPGYEATVGRWDLARHEAEQTNPQSRYLILEESEKPAAFAILQDLEEPHGNVLLRRIAVRERGRGHGRAAVRLVCDWVFARPGPYRLYLRVAVHNEAGRRAYAAAGMREEGVERMAHLRADGSRYDNVIMSILRPEWEARP